MATIFEARDAITKHIDDAWKASPTTSPFPLVYDDVNHDRPGLDANNLPQPFGRITVRHSSGREETLGDRASGAGREVYRGQVVVQVFTPKGDGFNQNDQLAQVVLDALVRSRFGTNLDGWFSDVFPAEIPATGPWNQINISADFRYGQKLAS